MAAEPIVYDNAFEGLYLKGLAPLGKLTPALKAKLKAAGLDLDQKLKGSYPKELWVRCMHLCAAEAFPALSAADAYFKLGEIAITGVANTLMGKALVSMAKMLGAKRSVKRLAQAFSSLNNFMTAEIVETGGTSCRIIINEVYGRPTYLLGGLTAIARLTGNGKWFEFKVTPGPGSGASFDFTWTD